MRKFMACVVCVVGGSGLVLADDWSVGPGGNSTRDCRSAGVGPSAATVLWQGVGVSDILETQPVISDGVVYTGRIINFTIPTGSRIVAQDLETGEQLWSVQLPYDDRANDPDFEGEWRGRVSSARDWKVYATRAGNTRSGPMYAIDAETGNILWESEDLVTSGTTEGNAFAPNGDLIVGSQVAGANNQIPGNVLRMNKDTGETIWKTDRSCPTSNGCSVAVFGGKVYLYEAGPVLTAFDLETGARLYTSEQGSLGGGFVQQVGLFVGPDGTIYCPRGQQGLPGELKQEFDTFYALEDTGSSLEVKWALPAGFTPFATMGVGPDGSVYAYRTPEDEDGRLLGELIVLRLDPADGSIVDQSAVIPCATVAPSPRMAIDANGEIYLTTSAGLFVLAPDLSERWREESFSDASGPALSESGILIVNGGGTDMRAFQTVGIDCPADWDGNGVVNAADVGAFLSDYFLDLVNGTLVADFDGNGVVNAADVGAFLSEYFQTIGQCP